MTMHKGNRGPRELLELIDIYRCAYVRLQLAGRPQSERERLARCVLAAGAKEDNRGRVLNDAIRRFAKRKPVDVTAASCDPFSLSALLKRIKQRFDDTDG